jgi:hypothetical protein
MTTTYVTFDTRSGQILSVHHGAVDSSHALEGAQHHVKISDKHISVIPVPSDAVEQGTLYKVDVGRNLLVTAAVSEGGVGFSFSEAPKQGSDSD